MGKVQSKHAAECFIVNHDFTEALEERFWKKSGLDLANCNIENSLQDFSLCLDDKIGCAQLRVELPPLSRSSDTCNVFKLDKGNEDRSGLIESRKEKMNNANIDEDERGLQVEEAETCKQEWFFTLYDFDGHGQIMKEDISSLLKALYDVGGSSIRLPPNGAKTLKLCLTVGQEQTFLRKVPPSNIDLLGGKGKENSRKKISVECHRKTRQLHKPNNLTSAPLKQNNHDLTNANYQGQGHKGDDALCKKKSPMLKDGGEPAVSVPANIDRKHVEALRHRQNTCFGSSDMHRHNKRRHVSRIHGHLRSVPTFVRQKKDLVTYDKTLGVDCCASTWRDSVHQESQDRRNYYLNLAGVDSKKLNNSNVCPHNKKLNIEALTDAVLDSAQSHRHDYTKCDGIKHEVEGTTELDGPTSVDFAAAPGHPTCKPGCAVTSSQLYSHFRSRSSDVAGPMKSKPTTSFYGPRRSNNHVESWQTIGLNCNEPTSSQKQHLPQFRPAGLPDPVSQCSSHHHRHHRHREKDRHEAMQQVATWIEQQSWDANCKGDLPVQHYHHVHEHHHHHYYHHYYET